jgi:hypothetical protein
MPKDIPQVGPLLWGLISCRALEIIQAAKLGSVASLRISGFFAQPRNLMKLMFYDIIAKVIAAQRFVASGLLLAAR